GIPSNIQVDLFTVQSGLHPIVDSYLASYSSLREPVLLEEVFLRNAVMVTTNVTGARTRLFGMQARGSDKTESPLICKYLYTPISYYGDGNKTMLISSDPYGVEVFEYSLLWGLDGPAAKLIFSIDAYSTYCAELTFELTYHNKSMQMITNPHDSLELEDWFTVDIRFNRRAHFGCSSKSPMNFHYIIIPSSSATTALPLHQETTASTRTSGFHLSTTQAETTSVITKLKSSPAPFNPTFTTSNGCSCDPLTLTSQQATPKAVTETSIYPTTNESKGFGILQSFTIMILLILFKCYVGC
uniref:CUB domain-containing protein n=1 Tax=Steinernema glaseri TaxID=37863 RepID=A0A1I8A444_9BILA